MKDYTTSIFLLSIQLNQLFEIIFCANINLIGETMKLYLLDDFDSKEAEIIKKTLSTGEEKFEELGDFDDANYQNNPELSSVCVISKIEHNFVSKDMFKFVKHLIKNQIKNQIKVVFVENIEDNSKIAIDWLVSLKNDNLLNINILGEFNRSNLSEELEILNKVTIYTDGACSGNPGAGGWGAILMHGNHAKEISGFEKETTNNRMELTAVIKALSLLKQPCSVELYSDSAYVVNAIKQGWLENWKNNGWVGSDKKQVKNIELWQSLDLLMQKHSVNFNKVKGHADNEFNNRCDALATGEIAKNANN